MIHSQATLLAHNSSKKFIALTTKFSHRYTHERSPKASHNNPTDPVFRANSFSKVTNLFCRLPLSTLFNQLEATHLGDLLRIWVRSCEKFIEPHLLFQGSHKALETSQ